MAIINAPRASGDIGTFKAVFQNEPDNATKRNLDVTALGTLNMFTAAVDPLNFLSSGFQNIDLSNNDVILVRLNSIIDNATVKTQPGIGSVINPIQTVPRTIPWKQVQHTNEGVVLGDSELIGQEILLPRLTEVVKFATQKSRQQALAELSDRAGTHVARLAADSAQVEYNRIVEHALAYFEKEDLSQGFRKGTVAFGNVLVYIRPSLFQKIVAARLAGDSVRSTFDIGYSDVAEIAGFNVAVTVDLPTGTDALIATDRTALHAFKILQARVGSIELSGDAVAYFSWKDAFGILTRETALTPRVGTLTSGSTVATAADSALATAIRTA